MNADRKAQRRKQIIQASLEAFAEQGYHATKISDIAEKLAIGHGTFYRYFANKLDIFSAVIDHIIERMTVVVAEEDPQSTDSLKEYESQIIRIGKRLYSLFMKDLPMARIVFYEALGVDPALNDKLDRVIDLVGAHIEAYLNNGISKGFLRPGIDVPITARAIGAMIFFGAKDIMSAPDADQAIDRWSRAGASLMLYGMQRLDSVGH